MPLFGTDPETMLVRTTVVSVALQSLIGRLAANGVIDKGDLVAMRKTGLQLAADLAKAGAGISGTRVATEVEAWWFATESLCY